jgi:hypothetical protein
VTVTHLGDVATDGQANCRNVITRTYLATDPCGNTDSCTQTILVDDSTGPTLTCPPPVTVTCFSQVPPPNPGSVTAVDNCATNSVNVIFLSDVSSNGTSNCTTITRTYKGTDSCGNMATCTQTITVADTIPPVITCPPNFQLPCGTPTDPSVTGSATATDNCGPIPPPTFSDQMTGSCADVNGATITRTWTANDGCNTATCTQIITLVPPPNQGCIPAYVIDLGGSCGNPAPKLTSSPPILGSYLAFRIYNAPPNAPILFAADPAPFPPPVMFGNGCTLWVDPTASLFLSSIFTDGNGDWTLRFLIDMNNLSLVNQLIRVQAGFVSVGGPAPVISLTNGLELFFGTCPPFCTATKDGFAGTGFAGQVFDANYSTVFPTGLDVGIFSPGALPPNGLHWDGTAVGRAALKSFLAGAGGPSGPIAADTVNPLTTVGGGSLALQAATLQLNIAFNNANLMGSGVPGFGLQTYWNYPGVPDSLNGMNVTQILGVANLALSGGALPAGYTYDSLALLLQNINEAYNGCAESFWGSKYLFAPNL